MLLWFRHVEARAVYRRILCLTRRSVCFLLFGLELRLRRLILILQMKGLLVWLIHGSQPRPLAHVFVDELFAVLTQSQLYRLARINALLICRAIFQCQLIEVDLVIGCACLSWFGDQHHFLFFHEWPHLFMGVRFDWRIIRRCLLWFSIVICLELRFAAISDISH